MSRRVFVAADFSQLETWLTAHFANDDVMQAELHAQLTGAHKIHALNAALLYEIEPEDAKKHMVQIKGQERPAYDGGKRVGHLFNYGGQAAKVAETLWLPLPFCVKAIKRLSTKYDDVVAWRQRLLDEVFGVAEYACPRCGGITEQPCECPSCSTRQYPVMTRWTSWREPPTYTLYTPFGRRRFYMGRRGECANAVASQLPQSCGASIWYRTLNRLIGPTAQANAPVPIEPLSVVELVQGRHVPKAGTAYVCTGTYDSFYVECDLAQADAVANWLAWTMEQPWPQLGGLRVPVEIEVGENWGPHSKDNALGLQEVHYRAFSATKP